MLKDKLGDAFDNRKITKEMVDVDTTYRGKVSTNIKKMLGEVMTYINKYNGNRL